MRPISEVEPIVKEVVARHAGVPPDQVHWQTTYTELDLVGPKKVSVMLELEVIFAVMLMPHIDEFITVGQTTEYIAANAPAQPTNAAATVKNAVD